MPGLPENVAQLAGGDQGYSNSPPMEEQHEEELDPTEIVEGQVLEYRYDPYSPDAPMVVMRRSPPLSRSPPQPPLT